MRGLTREIAEPDEVLARVNELLLAGQSLNDFATAMLLRMRREGEAWRLVLACAGHPPAVHAGPSGTVRLGGGSVLGGWAEPAVERHQAVLGPEDTLVLCTDGWLEAGPVAAHHDPRDLAEITRSLSDLRLEELTERLGADARRRGRRDGRRRRVVLERPFAEDLKRAGIAAPD